MFVQNGPYSPLAAFSHWATGPTQAGPMNDSKDRPVSMLTFVHYGDDFHLTLVISRAKNESLTHITMVCRAIEKKENQKEKK
jgi:hypothetical protein